MQMLLATVTWLAVAAARRGRPRQYSGAPLQVVITDPSRGVAVTSRFTRSSRSLVTHLVLTKLSDK